MALAEREAEQPLAFGPVSSVQGPTTLQLAAAAGDLATLVGIYGALLVAFDLHGSDPLRLATWCGALAAVWLAFAVRQRAYKLAVIRRRFLSPYIVAKVTILAGAVFHLLPLVGGRVDSRLTSASIVVALAMELAAWRLLLWWVARVARVPDSPVDLVVVGAGPAGRALWTALASSPGAGLRISAFVDPNPVLTSTRVGGVPVRALASLPDLVGRPGRPPRVVLALTDQVHAAVYEQLTALAQAGVEVVPVASVYEEATGRVPVWHLGHSWWAALPRPSTDLLYLALKRGLDLLGALVGLALLAALLPVVAPLLKRETRGSLFFSQRRVGTHGRAFTVHKLRTLPAQPRVYESHWERKRSNRASRVGALVRATGIDELPQCLNILQGEMSLVGPRPYVPDEVADFQARIPFFRSRALVKPGITGWAQVNWGYGLSLDDEIEKLQYDLYYVGHQSLYLDLLVLVRTLNLLLHGRRSAGPQPAAAPGA